MMKKFIVTLIFLLISCLNSSLHARMDRAPNGVPLMYIERPNERGVSYNRVDYFNVSPSGLILNNSLNPGYSKLGGVVPNNPNYINQTANLILNEVIGANRSLLAGYIEVFGTPANMILANPNGIICNGAGFINIPRATLTTGTPRFDSSGALQALSVDRGEIIIEGKGINVSNVNTFDLVTRTAKFNAKIYGKELGVFAGRQTFNYATRVSQAKTEDGQPKPEIAIDGQALGAMVANRITLVGTEKGVGVHLDPTMAMNADDIIINSQGQVVLKNQLTANKVKVASQDNMSLEGRIAAKGEVHLASNNQIKINNHLTAKKVDITSKGDMVLEGRLGVKDAATLTATEGKVTLNNHLTASKVDITSKGDMVLEGKMGVKETATFKAKEGNISLNNTLVANKIDITSQGNMMLEGRMAAQDTVNLTSDGQVKLNNVLTAKNVNAASQRDMILEGKMMVKDQVNLTSDSQVTLNNVLTAKKVDITSQKDMSLLGEMNVKDSATLKAVDGKVSLNNHLTANKLDITSKEDMDLEGKMAVKNTANLISDGPIKLNNVLRAKNINLTSQEDILLEGRMDVQETAMVKSLDGKVTLNNTLTADKLDVTSPSDMSLLGRMDVQDTAKLTSNGKMTFNNQLAAYKLDAVAQKDMVMEGKMVVKDTANFTSKDKIIVNNDLTAKKVAIDSQGDILLSGQMGVKDAATFKSSHGKITFSNHLTSHKLDALSQGDMILEGKMAVKDTANFDSQGKVAVNHTFIANKVDITSQDDMTVSGEMSIKDSATLRSNGKMTFNNNLTSHNLDAISQGDMTLGGKMEVPGAAKLTSNGDVLFKETLKAGKADITSQENIKFLSPMDVQEDVKINAPNGKVILDNTLTASKADITSGGDMSLAGVMKIKDTATLQALRGNITLNSILTANKVDMTSQEKNLLIGGSIEAGDTATLKAPNGAIIFEKETRTSGEKQLIAEAKTVHVKEGAGVVAGLDKNSDSVSGSQLVMTASQGIDNEKGVLRSGDKMTISTPSLHNDQGVIWSDGNMAVQGLNGQKATKVINDSGVIIAENGTLALDADTLHNRRKNFVVEPKKPEETPLEKLFRDAGISYESFLKKPQPITKIDQATANSASPSSLISSGKDMTIQATTLKNDYSHITAGRNMNLYGTTLEQKAVPIYQTEERTVTIIHQSGGGGSSGNAAGGQGNIGPREGGGSTWEEKVTEIVETQIGEVKATIEAKGNISAKFAGPIDNSMVIPFSKNIAGSRKEPLIPALASGKVDPISSLGQVKIESPFSSPLPEIAKIPFPEKNYPEISQPEINSSDLIQKITGGEALFKPTPPGHDYKIETRPNFVNLASFYGSDYFLSRIGGFDPNALPRRLGDAFFETTLVRQQILDQTGQRWLNPTTTSDRLQMQQLLDQGIQASKDLNLSVGIALTAKQANNLTQDIVWYVEQKVGGETVLVPRLYLAKATKKDVDSGGAIIMAENVDLKSDESIRNTGTIRAKKDLSLTAEKDLKNQSGTLKSEGAMTLVAVNGDIIHETPVNTVHGHGSFSQEIAPTKSLIESGGPLTMTAGQNIKVIGADIEAKGNTNLQAQNVSIEGQKIQQLSQSWGNYENDVTHEASSLSTDGNLTIKASKDIAILGSTVAAQGDTTFTANQITLGTTVDQKDRSTVWNEYTSNNTTHTGSVVTSGGNLKLEAGNNLAVIGSQVAADGNLVLQSDGGLQVVDVHDTNYFHQTTTQKKSFGRSQTTSTTQSSSISKGSLLSSGGELALDAGGNIDIVGSWLGAGDNITATTDQNFNMTSGTDSLYASTSSQKKGLLNSSSSSSVSQVQNQKSAALLSNQDILVQTKKDAKIDGSAMAARSDIRVEAGQDAIFGTTQNTAYAFSQSQSKQPFTRGFIAGLGGLGVGIGISKIQSWVETWQINQVPSILSAGKNIGITANRDIKTKVTQVQAGDSIDIKAGRDIVFEAGKNVSSLKTYQKTTETGISLGLNQTGIQSYNQINQAIQNFSAGEGSTLNEVLSGLSSGLMGVKAVKNIATGNLFELGAGLYGKKSTSQLNARSETLNPTTLNAGKDINAEAKTGSLTAEGTQMNAGENVKLEAEKDLNIVSAQNKYSVSSESEEKFGGFLSSIGFGLTGPQATTNLSTQLSQSTMDQSSVTHQNAQISAGKKLTTVSGEDTTIEGGNLSGNEVETKVGGNLTVASVQNTQQSTYRNKNLTLGVGIGTIGELFDFTGTLKNLGTALKDMNVNMGYVGGSYQKDRSDRKFTDNQTTIMGQEKVDIEVEKHTHVEGAVIGSTQGDVNLKTDSFSYKNLQDEDKSSSNKTSAFILGDPTNFTPRAGINSIPEIDVQRSKQTTEAISRATVAAPNGEEIITINAGSQESLAGLNQTLAQAQEIVNQENKSVRVVIVAPLVNPKETIEEIGDALEGLVKTFDQVSQALAGSTFQKLPETMKTQAEYLESQGYDRDAIYNVLSNPTYQKVVTGITSAINEGEVKGYAYKGKDSLGRFVVNMGPTPGEEILLEAAKVKDFIGTLPAEEASIAMAGMQLALGPVKFVASTGIQVVGQIVGGEYMENIKDTAAEKIMDIVRGYDEEDRRKVEGINYIASRDANPESIEGYQFSGARFLVDVMAGGIALGKGNFAKKPNHEPHLGMRDKGEPHSQHDKPDLNNGGVEIFSKIAPATAKQLQKKFKHAEDFGVTGNYSPTNVKKFNRAIQEHLNASGTKEISGTYRGNPVTFYTDPNTGLTVIQNPDGSFLSGWKLNPQQLHRVLKDGKL